MGFYKHLFTSAYIINTLLYNWRKQWSVLPVVPPLYSTIAGHGICQWMHIYTAVYCIKNFLPKVISDYLLFWPTAAAICCITVINAFLTYTDEKVREIEEAVDSRDKNENVRSALLILSVAYMINIFGVILWMHNNP
ncbi:MAG: hypothetical protein JWQ38_1100 [Flavipsychrobacter sp.]|nr:hypothetical protein [Flavipsychrobacter sp.]